MTALAFAMGFCAFLGFVAFVAWLADRRSERRAVRALAAPAGEMAEVVRRLEMLELLSKAPDNVGTAFVRIAALESRVNALAIAQGLRAQAKREA